MLDNIMEKETVPALVDDFIIPSRVANLDLHIAALKENLVRMQMQIRDAESDRVELLKRAKELGITDDGLYKIIEIPIYPKKHVDVAKLKQIAPDRYDQIIANIKAKLQDKVAMELTKADGFISQDDVKAVMKDKGLLAMVIPEPTEPSGYKVSVVKR